MSITAYLSYISSSSIFFFLNWKALSPGSYLKFDGSPPQLSGIRAQRAVLSKGLQRNYPFQTKNKVTAEENLEDGKME